MNDYRGKSVSLTQNDIAIIECLHKDARASISTIAETLSTPESTVRHRLNRLVEAGIVEFVALTNPLRLGYPVWIMMEIEVETRRIREVAKALSSLQEVYFVYITTGGFDVFAGATFRTNEEFVDFLSTRLSQIDGIIRINTRGILEVHKRTFKFTPKATGTPKGKKRSGAKS